ncbi:circadian clock KaiB family protein [Nocardioides psychrotolerans]|uniref:circadian clock KaiB family protein n=1 Tax=Nocardioides psychrotolerans TaxID=1005945 RepID=UPI001C3F8760|nr:circadian clock KaiB family protein [Nocardioides psychrotolerans]
MDQRVTAEAPEAGVPRVLSGQEKVPTGVTIAFEESRGNLALNEASLGFDLPIHPALASGDEILAVPKLVRMLPAPLRTIIGDLFDTRPRARRSPTASPGQEPMACRLDLKVIHAAEHPPPVTEDHILSLPTLVKRSPGPLRRLMGNLTDTARVRAALDLGAIQIDLDGSPLIAEGGT